MSTVGHVKLLASAIDVSTEVKDEVDTKSQVRFIITTKRLL